MFSNKKNKNEIKNWGMGDNWPGGYCPRPVSGYYVPRSELFTWQA